jgi:hypothetical protein
MAIRYGAFTPSTATTLEQDITNAADILIRDKYWVDVVNGNDQNSGEDRAAAVQSLAKAYDKCANGRNDAVVIVGDGGTGNSVRLTSTFTWAKNATHLLGAAPASNNTRARITTRSGASAFADFFVVTGTGCLFSNFSVFNDNAIAAQITWADQGGRNSYVGVALQGMGDTTSAGNGDSVILELGGASASGENLFVDCTIGLDTRARGAANHSVEFIGNSKRNVFSGCVFPVIASASTPLILGSSGTNPLETYQRCERCVFINQQSGGSGTTLAAVGTVAAAGNGQVIFTNCSRFDICDWGTESTSLAQMFVDGPATGATDDIGRGAVAIAT